ncbi:MAG: hypothetical protein WC554_13450 [Clostridia bacterium]|jgi:hypothetical protein
MKDTTREYRKEKGKWGTKNMTFSGTIVIVILFLLGASTLTAGCIKNAQHLIRDEGSTADMDPGVSGTAIPDITATTPAPHQITEITPAKSEIVSEVTPFTTPDPYPIIYGARINSTPQYAFQYRQPEFSKTYTLTGNAYGLLVNVVQGPLYIRYTVDPKYDCLKDPDSCRGTILVPVNRPYMTITIRDNQTQQIVAQDGYGGEYSSDIGHYHFYGTVTSDDSSETQPYNSYPGPRYIPVYKEGQFQVTIEGNYLDTNIGIITGTSPDPLDATEKSSAGTTTTTADDDEDW